MAMSVELVTAGFAVKLSVAIESQPELEMRVTEYVPAAG